MNNDRSFGVRRLVAAVARAPERKRRQVVALHMRLSRILRRKWTRTPNCGSCLFACLAFGVLLCSGSDVSAGGPATREEALAAAFPGAQIKPETIFLTERQMKEAAALAGVPIASALVARYRAFLNGKIVGRAYVDTHVVRTKKESLLIVLDEYGAVRRIEVTAFLEPPQYQASSQWYAQYKGKGLNNDLNLQRGIRPVAGATLTALAANQAVRRVLAIDQVLGS